VLTQAPTGPRTRELLLLPSMCPHTPRFVLQPGDVAHALSVCFSAPSIAIVSTLGSSLPLLPSTKPSLLAEAAAQANAAQTRQQEADAISRKSEALWKEVRC